MLNWVLRAIEHLGTRAPFEKQEHGNTWHGTLSQLPLLTTDESAERMLPRVASLPSQERLETQELDWLTP